MSTLAELYARVATDLGDPAYTIWSTAVLTDHIRDALHRYNRVNPRRQSTTITPAANVREHDVSTIPFLRITACWYPYDAANPDYPPELIRFEMLDDETLYTPDIQPDGTYTLRIFYTAAHTIEDLDSATDTTLDAYGESLVCTLASALAGMERAQYTTGRITVHAWTASQLLDWAQARHDAAEQQLTLLAAARALDLSGYEQWTL